MNSRLRSLTMQNFRLFEKAEIQFRPGVTILAGPNAAGKSTILDAISVALTGSCRGAETGRGLDELRRRGSKRKWGVSVEIESAAGIEAVDRTEGEGMRSKVQSEVDRLIGASPSQIRACLYSGELPRLGLKERQRLVLDLSRANRAEEVRIELPETVQKALQSPVGPVTLAEAKSLYDRLFAERRAAGGYARVNVVAPDPPPGMEGKSVSEVRALIDGARGRLRGLIEAQGAAERHAILAKDAEIYRSWISTGQKAHEARKKELHDELAKILEESTEINSKLQALSQEEADAYAQKALAEEGIAELVRLEPDGTTGGSCRVCGSSLSPSRAAARKTELEQMLSVCGQALSEIEKQRLDLRRRAEDARGRERAVRTQVLDCEQVERTHMTLAQRVAGFNEQDAPGNPEELEQRIEKGTKLIETLTAYVGALTAYEQIAADRDENSTVHELLDQAVKALGPEFMAGFGEQKEDEETPSFVSAVSLAIAQLMNCHEVDLTPLVRAEDDPTVNGVPLRLLSTSEQTMFGISFQIAVATVTGIGLVAVDDFEHLAPDTAKRAFQALADSGHQAFVFQVLRDRDKFSRLTACSTILIEKGGALHVHKAA